MHGDLGNEVLDGNIVVGKSRGFCYHHLRQGMVLKNSDAWEFSEWSGSESFVEEGMLELGVERWLRLFFVFFFSYL